MDISDMHAWLLVAGTGGSYNLKVPLHIKFKLKWELLYPEKELHSSYNKFFA